MMPEFLIQHGSMLQGDMMDIDPLTILIRLGLAGILGSIIGAERSIHGRPAGLRTHLLVSLGSASFMILSILISAGAGHRLVGEGAIGVFSDPARIAAQVVTGIGFLGAGVIIKEGINVRGLTTAACLWATASIGMATGAGFYLMALATSFIALVGLLLFPKIEALYPKDSYFKLHIVVTNGVDLTPLQELFIQRNLIFRKQSLKRNYEKNQTEILYHLNIKHKPKSHLYLTKLVATIEETGLPLISLNWSRL
ncbi:MAG: MgtC/SapB family protein [SAR324 cluster bacterium]|nr:MgtC/SapB family protein [SAR324 cluster bacterium]